MLQIYVQRRIRGSGGAWRRSHLPRAGNYTHARSCSDNIKAKGAEQRRLVNSPELQYSTALCRRGPLVFFVCCWGFLLARPFVSSRNGKPRARVRVAFYLFPWHRTTTRAHVFSPSASLSSSPSPAAPPVAISRALRPRLGPLQHRERALGVPQLPPSHNARKVCDQLQHAPRPFRLLARVGAL